MYSFDPRFEPSLRFYDFSFVKLVDVDVEVTHHVLAINNRFFQNPKQVKFVHAVLFCAMITIISI